MGLYVEQTYAMYGNYWREGLFYTHFLALPLFIPLSSNINSHIKSYMASPRLTLPLPSAVTALLPWHVSHPPSRMFYLFLNVFTQYVCVRGVNLLGSSVTALTVTIVLNIRKLASLLLSIWLFGNRLNTGVMVGAALVFIGGGLYGWEGARKNQQRKAEEAKEKAKKKQ
jgi:solute carrier family 35 (UDP-xylose/UDP-N-acetylglucosamine transporter), member B4